MLRHEAEEVETNDEVARRQRRSRAGIPNRDLQTTICGREYKLPCHWMAMPRTDVTKMKEERTSHVEQITVLDRSLTDAEMRVIELSE